MLNGTKIEMLRKKFGMSARKLGLMAGVDGKTIAKAERGEDINLKKLCAIARALDMPPAYFLE